jgi:hypothetical protein
MKGSQKKRNFPDSGSSGVVSKLPGPVGSACLRNFRSAVQPTEWAEFYDEVVLAQSPHSSARTVVALNNGDRLSALLGEPSGRQATEAGTDYGEIDAGHRGASVTRPRSSSRKSSSVLNTGTRA